MCGGTWVDSVGKERLGAVPKCACYCSNYSGHCKAGSQLCTWLTVIYSLLILTQPMKVAGLSQDWIKLLYSVSAWLQGIGLRDLESSWAAAPRNV